MYHAKKDQCFAVDFRDQSPVLYKQNQMSQLMKGKKRAPYGASFQNSLQISTVDTTIK